MKKFIDELKATASIYSKDISESAIILMVNMLSKYNEQQLLSALHKHLRTGRFFPTIADIISNMVTNHPSVEEAWALVPKDEYATAVMNQVIQKAFSACCSLLEEDPIAARMTFKEVYQKELQQAITNNEEPVWYISVGQDKNQRDSVIHEAIQKNRITLEYARNVVYDLPDLGKQRPQLNEDIKKMLQKL